MAFMATHRRVETAVKTNEIMARFRPIAPKPVLALPPTNAVMSSQRRSTSKRGGRDLVPAPTDKRLRGAPSSYPYYPIYRASPWTSSCLVAPPTSSRRSTPVERQRDLLRKQQEPKVIVPRPTRPVRTTICVDTSSVTGANSVKLAAARRMTAEQVLAGMERDALPAVMSDPSNRVIRANDAYKALVGQPVCPWLDSLHGGDAASASRRINGEVVLDVRRFNSTETTTRASAGGTFSCNSRISWERDGTLASVAAPCDVARFGCSSGGYLFVWRFDTSRGSVVYCPAYKIGESGKNWN